MSLYINAEDLARAKRADKELIPRRLVYAMGGLALFSLALTSFAVLTDRPLVGQPKDAPVLAERQIVLNGTGNGAHITAPDGAIIHSTPDGGFIAAVRQGLFFERRRHGLTDNSPITVTRFANGRLSLSDPATGWSVELTSFGADNLAAWDPVLPE